MSGQRKQRALNLYQSHLSTAWHPAPRAWAAKTQAVSCTSLGLGRAPGDLWAQACAGFFGILLELMVGTGVSIIPIWTQTFWRPGSCCSAWVGCECQRLELWLQRWLSLGRMVASPSGSLLQPWLEPEATSVLHSTCLRVALTGLLH